MKYLVMLMLFSQGLFALNSLKVEVFDTPILRMYSLELIEMDGGNEATFKLSKEVCEKQTAKFVQILKENGANVIKEGVCTNEAGIIAGLAFNATLMKNKIIFSSSKDIDDDTLVELLKESGISYFTYQDMCRADWL